MKAYTWDDIRRGLKLYADEETDSEYYIDDKTYKNAIKLSNVLEHFKFPVPRIFSHGGDTSVFIWGELSTNGSKSLQAFISITEEGPGRLTFRNYSDATGN